MRMTTNDRTTTVEALCSAAGLEYAMLNSPDRLVHLRRGGGHQRKERTDTSRADLYVDLNLLPQGSKQQRIKETLIVLAVDLGCYEAGESLAMEGIVEPTRNGRYLRKQRHLLASR